jgi:hypothetical protein
MAPSKRVSSSFGIRQSPYRLSARLSEGRTTSPRGGRQEGVSATPFRIRVLVHGQITIDQRHGETWQVLSEIYQQLPAALRLVVQLQFS